MNRIGGNWPGGEHTRVAPGSAGATPYSGDRSGCIDSNRILIPGPPGSHRQPNWPDRNNGQRTAPEHLICTSAFINTQAALATPNGGSARLIHSLCSPVGGRPASPRKSHSKSQRRPSSGDSQLRQATVEAGQTPGDPHRGAVLGDPTYRDAHATCAAGKQASSPDLHPEPGASCWPPSTS